MKFSRINVIAKKEEQKQKDKEMGKGEDCLLNEETKLLWDDGLCWHQTKAIIKKFKLHESRENRCPLSVHLYAYTKNDVL